MPKLDFETLKFTKDAEGHSQLSKEQKDEISTLFCKLTEGNTIFVLRPNEVLSNEVLDKYRDEGYDFDYNNVNLPQGPLKENHKNYFWYMTQKNAFSTTYNQLRHDVTYAHDTRKIENPNFHYFVVEEDRNSNHMVRGIVKGTYKEGFSFCINPEHKERIANRKRENPIWIMFNDEEPKALLDVYQNKINDYLANTPDTFPKSTSTSSREGKEGKEGK